VSDNSHWEVEHRKFIITIRLKGLFRISAEVRRKDKEELLYQNHIAVEDNQFHRAAAFRGERVAPSQKLIQDCEKWIDNRLDLERDVLAELVRYRAHRLDRALGKKS
jgi:hypothetical protein